MIARFARLGLLGFGGPTGHVVLMRRQWLDSGDLEVDEFNDAFAAVSLLPGPMSTQLAMWIGWRVRGYRGLLLAAALFVVPAVSMVLVLSSFVLGANHPIWLVAAALGAGAVVPAIALRAAIDIAGSYHVATLQRSRLIRLVIYVVVGVRRIPCPKPSLSPPVAPRSVGPLRARSSTCAPTTSPPWWCAKCWPRCPNLDPQSVEDLIVGCGQPAGESGFNVARVARCSPDSTTCPG
jgi:chromate transport protein ChrA